MKLEDKGAFFAKMKDGSIWFTIYYKTNLLRSLKPEPMLHSPPIIDMVSKEFKFTEKRHAPNKIWYTSFDNKGVDYVAITDITPKEFKKQVLDVPIKTWFLNDYPKPEDLYEAMKASDLKKVYTKKWFQNEYTFIQKQLGLAGT